MCRKGLFVRVIESHPIPGVALFDLPIIASRDFPSIQKIRDFALYMELIPNTDDAPQGPMPSRRTETSLERTHRVHHTTPTDETGQSSRNRFTSPEQTSELEAYQ